MLYFLVYNDNTHNNYLDKLLESVKIYGKEFEIIIFNKTDIDPDFYTANASILNCSRGGGYWLWKPYIIYETLKKINDNDIVFYIDSKYYFIKEFTNIILDYMKNNDLIVWKNKPNQPIYKMNILCKMDVIQKYNMYDTIINKNADDCWAGALVVKKTENSIKYIKEWLDMCCIYEDITDTPSKLENNDDFYEHRHDQSLLSIVLHKYNIDMLFFENSFLQNVRCSF